MRSLPRNRLQFGLLVMRSIFKRDEASVSGEGN